MPTDPQTGIYFETHGSGIPLLMGFPVLASHDDVFGPEMAGMRDRFLSYFTDRYQVLVMDYPGIGKSADMDPAALTADRVCHDILRTADCAGFKRFAFWGYSWGAALGPQLAARTDRLSALIMGGWPPLGADYERIRQASFDQIAEPPESGLVVLRTPEQYAQWFTFYDSITGFDERAVAIPAPCPAMAYVGALGDVLAGTELIRNATIMRTHQSELEAAGWKVEFIEGAGHEVGLQPDIVAPMVRRFLDLNLTEPSSGRFAP